MNKHEMKVTPFEFDEQTWRKRCEELAQSAHKGCGLSHDLFVQRFGLAIDTEVGVLPDHHRQLAISIARNWDYASLEEREEQQEWLSDNNYCTHGIELGCCPAGCGS